MHVLQASDDIWAAYVEIINGVVNYTIDPCTRASGVHTKNYKTHETAKIQADRDYYPDLSRNVFDAFNAIGNRAMLAPLLRDVLAGNLTLKGAEIKAKNQAKFEGHCRQIMFLCQV